MHRSCVIEIQWNDSYFMLDLFKHEKHSGFVITYNQKSQTLIIDRGDLENRINADYGTTRKLHLENGLQEHIIFVDHSSVEMFINDGEYVSSSRIFPTLEEKQMVSTGNGNEVTVYQAKRTVEDDFIIYPEQ
mgnify:FL=1